jgi:putative flippase GtrA
MTRADPPAPAGLKSLAGLVARFGVAGLINTVVGFLVIETLDVGLGVQSNIANGCGYAVGMGVGFVLNHGFVFRYQGGRGVVARYLAVVMLAFLVNQAVLVGVHALLGPTPLMRTAAQLAGMASYTALTFILCQQWVFRSRIMRAEPAAVTP